MSQNGLAAFEPALVNELVVFVEWASEYMHRSGDGDPDKRTCLRDEIGGGPSQAHDNPDQAAGQTG